MSETEEGPLPIAHCRVVSRLPYCRNPFNSVLPMHPRCSAVGLE